MDVGKNRIMYFSNSSVHTDLELSLILFIFNTCEQICEDTYTDTQRFIERFIELHQQLKTIKSESEFECYLKTIHCYCNILCSFVPRNKLKTIFKISMERAPGKTPWFFL